MGPASPEVAPSCKLAVSVESQAVPEAGRSAEVGAGSLGVVGNLAHRCPVTRDVAFQHCCTDRDLPPPVMLGTVRASALRLGTRSGDLGHEMARRGQWLALETIRTGGG